MLTARCLLLLLSPFIVLGPSWATTTPSANVSTTTAVHSAFNSSAYLAVCGADDFSLENVCGVHGDMARVLGKDLDTRYLASKVASETTVGRLATTCPAGVLCKESWDQVAVDRLKLGWRDARLRKKICNLRPCLQAMLQEKAPPACNNTMRFLNFRAIQLLCDITDRFEPQDLMGCEDAAVELLQYSMADAKRGKSSMREVCDCTGKPGKACPVSCKPLIMKFVCLSTRCSIDSGTYLDKFSGWSWYFKKEAELRKLYKVNICEEEIIESQQRPFVVAVVNFYGLQNAIIAICISIVIASLLAATFFICYRRAAFARISSRNRRDYTEMKEEL